MTADEIGRILDELGERLGPTGSHVFELAVRQVVISSTITLIFAIGLFVVSLVAFVASVVAAYRGHGGEGPWNLGAISLIVGALGAVVSISCIVPLLNPEYKALMDLIGAIR